MYYVDSIAYNPGNQYNNITYRCAYTKIKTSYSTKKGRMRAYTLHTDTVHYTMYIVYCIMYNE